MSDEAPVDEGDRLRRALAFREPTARPRPLHPRSDEPPSSDAATTDDLARQLSIEIARFARVQAEATAALAREVGRLADVFERLYDERSAVDDPGGRATEGPDTALVEQMRQVRAALAEIDSRLFG